MLAVFAAVPLLCRDFRDKYRCSNGTKAITEQAGMT